MLNLQVSKNEATAARRRVYFYCVDATDGITPETGEAGGQPQVSLDGAAFGDTGIGTLTAIGNGRYYADLTQTLVNVDRGIILTRYKSAATAECVGSTVQIGQNITEIDGALTNGNNATLNLKQLNVQNSAGDAIYAKSTNSGSHGIYAEGNAAGTGLYTQGGATGYGIYAGGANGLRTIGTAHGLYAASGGNSSGIYAAGAGTGAGIYGVGGATGHGLQVLGGATSGSGILAQSQNGGHGIYALGNGIGNGLNAVSGTGATGNGIHAQAQSTNGHGLRGIGIGSGNGMYVTAGSAAGDTGHGLYATGGQTAGATGNGIYGLAAISGGTGLLALGKASGHGISGTGGSGGNGILATGGSTSGSGIKAAAVAGNSNGLLVEGFGQAASAYIGSTNCRQGLHVVGNNGYPGIYATGGGSTGAGIEALGGTSGAEGILATGSGSGAGIKAAGGATGHGIYALAIGNNMHALNANAAGTGGHGIVGYSADAHGMYLDGGANGDDLKLATGDTELATSADVSTINSTINTLIGTPAGASVSADIAALSGVVSEGVPHYYAPNNTDAPTVGNVEAGAISDTVAQDDTYYQVGESASGTFLEQLIGISASLTDHLPAYVSIVGFYNGSTTGHGIQVYAYDYVAAAFEPTPKLTMLHRTAEYTYAFPVDVHNHHPSTGAMLLKFVHTASASGNANHYLRLNKVEWSKVEATNQSALEISAILSQVNDIDLEVDEIANTTLPALSAAVADVPNTVWDEALSGHVAAGSAGEALAGAVSGVADPSAIAEAVWDVTLADHAIAGSTGDALDLATEQPADPPSVGDIADAVWDEPLTGHDIAGTTGEELQSSDWLYVEPV